MPHIYLDNMARPPAIPTEFPYLEVDMTALIRLKKEYEKDRNRIWEAAARRHRMNLFRRFIALASITGGSRQWAALEESTIKRKKRRGIATNPNWILREGSVLAYAIRYIVQRDGYTVGYVDRSIMHPRFDKSVVELADIHHRGIARQGGRLPRRPVIVMPTRNVWMAIVRTVQEGFGKAVESVNREVYASRRGRR